MGKVKIGSRKQQCRRGHSDSYALFARAVVVRINALALGAHLPTAEPFSRVCLDQ